MNFKEKLSEYKKQLVPLKKLEFEATLEDHPIENQNTYRLYFVNYHRFGIYYKNKVGMINWPCKPFKLPQGMTREEGFKIISYLTDCVEKRDNIEPYSLKSIITLDKILDLERFGFTRVEEQDENKILNLFTVSGRLELFKKSELYSKYFEWYIENITLEEVTKIYAKYNKEFKDVVWLNNQSDKNASKVLKS